jgi:hypothetical protein
MENYNNIIIITLTIVFLLINVYTVYNCNNTIYYLKLKQRLQYYSYLYKLNELSDTINSENKKKKIEELANIDDSYENFADTTSMLLDQLNKASDYNNTNNLLLQDQLNKDKKELEKVKLGTKLLNQQNKFGVQTLQKNIKDTIIKTADDQIVNNLQGIQTKMNQVNNVIVEKNNIVSESKKDLANAEKDIKTNQEKLNDYINNNKVPTLDSIKKTIPINI